VIRKGEAFEAFRSLYRGVCNRVDKVNGDIRNLFDIHLGALRRDILRYQKKDTGTKVVGALHTWREARGRAKSHWRWTAWIPSRRESRASEWRSNEEQHRNEIEPINQDQEWAFGVTEERNWSTGFRGEMETNQTSPTNLTEIGREKQSKLTHKQTERAGTRMNVSKCVQTRSLLSAQRVRRVHFQGCRSRPRVLSTKGAFTSKGHEIFFH
jgi:hypothetical protein